MHIFVLYSALIWISGVCAMWKSILLSLLLPGELPSYRQYRHTVRPATSAWRHDVRHLATPWEHILQHLCESVREARRGPTDSPLHQRFDVDRLVLVCDREHVRGVPGARDHRVLRVCRQLAAQSEATETAAGGAAVRRRRRV